MKVLAIIAFVLSLSVSAFAGDPPGGGFDGNGGGTKKVEFGGEINKADGGATKGGIDHN